MGKKKDYRIKEFDPVIYPTRLFVAIRPSYDEVRDRFGFLDEDGNEVSVENEFKPKDTSIAQTYTVYDKESRWKGCFVTIWRKADVRSGIIAHESSHCADWLDDELGGLGSVDGRKFLTGEPRAYYTQWVANCIEDVLKGRV